MGYHTQTIGIIQNEGIICLGNFICQCSLGPPRWPPPPPAEYGPAAYSYSWAVKDDYTSNNYGQNEDRNGAVTKGSYYVALPDGRLQKVTYSVDAYGGYVADVSYEGEAQYPEAKPYVPAPAAPAAY